MSKQTVFINKSIRNNFCFCESLAKNLSKFHFFYYFKLAIALLAYLLHFLTKIKQMSISMFSPVNSNGAYVPLTLQTRALADKDKVQQMRRGMDSVQQHLQQQINREALERMQSMLKLSDDFV
jgi:hypothetical protein